MDETTNQSAQADETNEDSNKLDDDESNNQSESDADDEFDYAEELERVRGERDNYKEGMLSAKRKLKKLQSEEVEEEDADEAIDSTNLSKLKKEIAAELKREMVKDALEEVADQLASNESERKLILYHYENTINPSGTTRQAIERDLRRARLMANESLLLKERRELKKALQAKNNVTTGKAGASQKTHEPNLPKLSPAEEAILRRRGLTAKDLKN